MDKITITDLVKLEPRLKDLMRDILNSGDELDYCADKLWYREIKPRFLRIIGRYATTNNEILKSSYAYDIAYQFLYNLLPVCTHENPLHLANYVYDREEDYYE